MIQTILITGGGWALPIIQSLKALGEVLVVDPMSVDSTDAKSWSEPKAKTSIVAFNNLKFLDNAALQVGDAMDWCVANNATLYLREQSRADIEDLGIKIPEAALELSFNESGSLQMKGNPKLESHLWAASCLDNLTTKENLL